MEGVSLAFVATAMFLAKDWENKKSYLSSSKKVPFWNPSKGILKEKIGQFAELSTLDKRYPI